MNVSRNFLRRGLSLSLVVLLSAVFAFGQARGTLRGVVKDELGGTVTGATVTLRNNNTGVASTRPTYSTGHYLFDLVEPGTYSLTVELAGFNRSLQENILVQNRGDVTVNVVTLAVTGGAQIGSAIFGER